MELLVHCDLTSSISGCPSKLYFQYKKASTFLDKDLSTYNRKSELTQPYTTVSQMLLKITLEKLVTVLIPHLDHIHKNSEFHHQGFGWQKD